MATQTLEKRSAEERAPAERTWNGRSYVPAVDIYETKDELLLVADMPGANGNEIDIHFEQGELTISAPVASRQPETTAYLLGEYGTGGFHRSFRISEAIDASRISAEYKEGVLTLHLPKVEAVKPRKIEVKATS
jgi:HSP20 family protein